MKFTWQLYIQRSSLSKENLLNCVPRVLWCPHALHVPNIYKYVQILYAPYVPFQSYSLWIKTVFMLFICDALRVPLYNLKNVQNTHWGVLLTHWQPEACSITKSYTPPSAFLMFFKLCTHGTKSCKAFHIFELLEFLRQTLMHWSNIQQKHSCIYLFYLSIYYKIQ